MKDGALPASGGCGNASVSSSSSLPEEIKKNLAENYISSRAGCILL